MLYTATIESTLAEVTIRVVAIAMCLFIASREMRTSYKLSWVFLILFLPVFGLPAYFIFGRSGLTRKMRRGMEKVSEKISPFRAQDDEICESIKAEDFYAYQQARYLSDVAGYPVYREEDSRYYSSTESLFPQLLADLKSAEHYIFMEYFIVEPGVMFDKILDILKEKAKEGVDVRLICDDVGCIQTLPPKFYKNMREYGIRCVGFNPFRPVLSVIMNNRDHRKIAVIDGWIGYTGGFNLADEYINKKKKFGYWKDAAVRLTGACVWSFTSMFLEMWDYITGEESDYALYRSQSAVELDVPSKEGGYVQPYSDSPLDHEDVGENVYLNLINHAKDYVYIFTPYLILGSEMRTALCNAAKCGVDVRIVVPAIPDKKMVYMLAQSEFSHLIECGVKIYKYTPGFIHSKCFVVDDVQATVGTINLDYRSLYLHFECGTSLYKAEAVMQVKADALKTFEESHEVTYEESMNRLWIVRVFMGVLRLFAPLL
jgi:cardiolipin synthase